MRTRSPNCARIRPHRVRNLGVAALICLSGPVHAQSSPASSETCVDVRVGTDQSYSCINAALGRAAAQARTPVNPGTLSATSPANQVGTFNRAATAQRMGDAFGRSVISQRPPPPVFASPLLNRPPR